jgi:hypothetical protein
MVTMRTRRFVIKSLRAAGFSERDLNRMFKETSAPAAPPLG